MVHDAQRILTVVRKNYIRGITKNKPNFINRVLMRKHN
jgi:hypothetical protein